MANFMGILTAKTDLLGTKVRQNGIQESGAKQCIVYTSTAAHGCVKRAMEMSGFGAACLRCIPVLVDTHQMDLDALRSEIARTKTYQLEQQHQQQDNYHPHVPMMVIATVGAVDTGAVDDLVAIGM